MLVCAATWHGLTRAHSLGTFKPINSSAFTYLQAVFVLSVILRVDCVSGSSGFINVELVVNLLTNIIRLR